MTKLKTDYLFVAFLLAIFFTFGLQLERYFSNSDKKQAIILELREERESFKGTIVYLSRQLYETDEFIFSECAGEQTVASYEGKAIDRVEESNEGFE